LDSQTQEAAPGGVALVEWNTFFDAVESALKLHEDSTRMPDTLRPVFIEDYPKEREGKFDNSLDVILWAVDASTMAPNSNDGGRIPNGIMMLGQQSCPDKAGYLTQTWGWRELMTARFTVYAKSNERVNELTAWFHRMMMIYAFGYKFFQARGVTYFKFLKRERDELSTDFGQTLYRTHLLYQVRLDLRNAYEAKTLDTAEVSLGMRRGGEVEAFDVNIQTALNREPKMKRE
jgi:hypothetical protein